MVLFNENDFAVFNSLETTTAYPDILLLTFSFYFLQVAKAMIHLIFMHLRFPMSTCCYYLQVSTESSYKLHNKVCAINFLLCSLNDNNNGNNNNNLVLASVLCQALD